MFDFLMDKVMPWFVGLILVVAVGMVLLIPVALYAEYKAEKFYLRKDQWTCTASRLETSTTYIQSGNVMVPITSTHKHCTQWSER